MFASLGSLVARSWAVVLLVWVVLLAVVWAAAPPWNEVAQDREFAFLPASAPSRVAEAVFARAFPDEREGSNVALVFRRSAGIAPQDRTFIDEVLYPILREIADQSGGLVRQIRTPVDPGTGALLLSPDGQAALVVLELGTEFLTRDNWPLIGRVETAVADLRAAGRLPEGLAVDLTGSAVLGRDRTLAQLHSARATETWTVTLVVLLLLAIYRAPLLTLIPVATVFVSVQVALSLLALLGGAGWLTLFPTIQIFVTVLTYGAGVDYCLFLMARYREELEGGADPRGAVTAAVAQVGAALTASAATVICGIGMMVFASFGKFREAGAAIPLSLFVALAAALTLTPALMRLTGRWAFWPYGPRDGHGFRRGWEWLGRALARRPGAVWLASVAVMLPFAAAAIRLDDHRSYDPIGTLPADAPSVAGTRALQDHFPAGVLGTVTVLVVHPGADFGSDEGRVQIAELTDRLRERRADLGLADVRSLAAPLGVTPAARRALAGLNLPEDLVEQAVRQQALDRYVTDLGERAEVGTRLEFVLEANPFTRRSLDDLNRIEEAVRAALPAPLRGGAEVYALGVTASVRDLRTVVNGDQRRIEILVSFGVLVILIALLRRVGVALYLLASVLLSFFATLGVTFAVFWLLDPAGFAGVDWKVPVFLFTILVAVGEDYNIFLMSRIEEEQARHGRAAGVLEALTRTGPIISSCGLIMAGTFASLLAGNLVEMKQLGFALAFGVLLDTFVVRPVLVPAFLLWTAR